jgi:O-antigen/teichoic acid export membrane protein
VSEAASNRNKSVRSSLFWASFGQIAFFVLQFGSSVVLARLLSPREMGIFAIGVATVGLISIVQALGLNNYLIRADHLEKSVLSTVFTVNLALSSLLSLAIIGVGFIGNEMFHDPGPGRVMFWLAATPLIGAIGLVPTSLLQREGDFRALSVLRICGTAAGTLLTVVLAFAGFSYMSLAYGWVLTCAVNALCACMLRPAYVHLALGFRDWRQVSNFGLQMVVINGATQVQRQLLNLTAGRILGVESVGLFSRANSLVNLLYENLQTVAARVFLVDFADAVRGGEPLAGRYQRVVEFMTALLWPLFAGLAVLSGPCVRIIYGAKWAGIALPLSMLCVSGMLWISVSMAWELFIIGRETARQSRLEIVRTTFGTLVWILACYRSLDLAIASRIVESSLAVYLYWPHIERITGSRPKQLYLIYLRSALLTAVAIAPATAMMMLYSWSPAVPLLPMAASIALGIGAYCGALYLLRHPLGDEAVNLLRLWRKRRLAG